MLVLPAELTLAQAHDCQARLLAQVTAQSGPAVQLDASALVRFDSAALAVLLACRRASLAAGRGFAVQGLPPKLAQLAGLYGVESLLLPPG